ncbi:expressed unknown protein [Seminavis robusta]|uniref:Secreted protein n=1 Tax=Seminavis robusta TaxID=568900 RepID=A0A9N8DGW7_9STRA|nr:expressed unknown protein [Seminavis robusta]|eukprot:Sro114_g056390.1 n/a (170) ;mRNA; f:53948-54457
MMSSMMNCRLLSTLLFLLVASVLVAAEESHLRHQQAVQEDHDQACVTLLEYKHRDCGGDPVSVRNNTVWTSPGMPCKHTDRMGSNSVTDEYCDKLDTDSPEFHQKVFVKDQQCHVAWYQKAYSPMHLTYTTHSCTYGYKIQGCTKGPCANPSPPLMQGSEVADEINQEE